MTASTTTPSIPAAQPAAVLTRRTAKPKAPTRTRVESVAAWKSAIEDAQVAVGYDKNSPIWGMTDLEVLQAVYEALTNTTPHNAMAPAIQELIKRKTAKVIAGQTYRQP